MSDETPTPEGVTPEGTPAAEETPKPVTAEDVAKLQAALDKERTTRKEFERQVKDFDNQRKATMTEAERAVADAEERGRKSAVTAFGERLASTEFRAAAATRNPEFDVAKALKYVNLASFLGEDGEPDTKAILAAVADLIPERGNPGPSIPRPDPSQGARFPGSVSGKDAGLAEAQRRFGAIKQ